MLDGGIVKGFGQLHQDYRDINIYAANTSCGYITHGKMAISFFASQSGCRALTAFPRTLGSRGSQAGDTAMSPGHMGDVLVQPPSSWHWALYCQAVWITPAGTPKRCSHCNTTRIISSSSPQPLVTSSTSLGDSWCLRRALVVFQWQETEAFCRPSAAACVLS